MPDLAFAPQHNMIAYLEKTESNAEFHQIVNFLTSSSIYHSLNVSPTIYASNIEQFWNSTTSQTINVEKQIHAIVDGKTVVISESSVRRDLVFNDANGITCLTNKQIFENFLLMGNTIRKSEKFSKTVTPLFATMLAPPTVVESEGSGNPPESQPTPSPAQPINESQILESSLSPQTTQTPRQTLEGTGGAMAQIRSEGELIQSIDPPLSTGRHTPGSDEGSMTLKELTDLCTTLLQKVFDLENVKTAQEKEIASLKKRITKLEQRQRSRFSGVYPFRAGASKRNSVGRRKVSKQERKILKSQQMFQDIDDALDEDADTKMIVKDKGNGEKRGSTAETISTARPDISDARPGDSTTGPKTPPTTTTLFDDEDVTIADTLKSKKMDQDQIERDAKVSLKIQAYLNEKARTERERQEEASKATLAEMYDEKRLAKERAEAIRSEPPTKTQLRNLMMTYLKHTNRFTHAQLKSRSFEEIQKLYIQEQKWVDVFVLIGSEEYEKRNGSRKKRAAGSSSKHKSTKKQKMNDQDFKDSDKEHRKCLKVVPDDDKAIDYKTLDVKSLILDFLDRQDVLDLHKIIMERFLANDPEGYDLIL
nr:hypothetical protein [Tanacetum cinerariifolium]